MFKFHSELAAPTGFINPFTVLWPSSSALSLWLATAHVLFFCFVFSLWEDRTLGIAIKCYCAHGETLGSVVALRDVEESHLWPSPLQAHRAALSPSVEDPLSPYFIILVSWVLWNSGPTQVARSNLVASYTETCESSRRRSCPFALDCGFDRLPLKVEVVNTERMEQSINSSLSPR